MAYEKFIERVRTRLRWMRRLNLVIGCFLLSVGLLRYLLGTPKIGPGAKGYTLVVDGSVFIVLGLCMLVGAFAWRKDEEVVIQNEIKDLKEKRRKAAEGARWDSRWR